MKNVAKVINVVVCSTLFVLLMYFTYGEWSKNGDYTIMSFLYSLLFDGCLMTIIGTTVNKVINKLYND